MPARREAHMILRKSGLCKSTQMLLPCVCEAPHGTVWHYEIGSLVLCWTSTLPDSSSRLDQADSPALSKPDEKSSHSGGISPGTKQRGVVCFQLGSLNPRPDMPVTGHTDPTLRVWIEYGFNCPGTHVTPVTGGRQTACEGVESLLNGIGHHTANARAYNTLTSR